MSKKFTKTVLSTALAGVLFGVSFGVAAEEIYTKGEYKVIVNGVSAIIYKNNDPVIAGINTKTGSAITINQKELLDGSAKILKENGLDPNKPELTADVKGKIQNYINTIKYPVYAESLKKENLQNITVADIEKIRSNVDAVSTVITSKTAADYNQAVSNGMSSENALKIAGEKNASVLLNEFGKLNKNVNQLKNATTFALDENGEITDGQGVESVSVKSVVAGVKADTTIYQNKDGSYTLDQSAPGNVRVNDAVVSLDNRTRSNTQAIQSHSRQLQEHNARLNSQQRQIRENHEEMKRAAAQSAALSGLFQPYSVGKFNATAALGGYSDKQAVAVGVG
ncbi:TPA: YadA-like family protein, partial [Escherichia coli]|nr:YadA-like family protein [Escherichia coli]